MPSGSNVKNTPAVLIIVQVDASKFESLTSSTWGFVCKLDKGNETCIPTNESQIKSSRVLISEWLKGSKSRPVLKIFSLFTALMNDLPASVVLLGEAMYQRGSIHNEHSTDEGLSPETSEHFLDFGTFSDILSCYFSMYQSAFLSLEFRLDTVKICFAWPS